MEQTQSEITDVIIVGAGMAGISAASKIKSRNSKIRVIILEAADRIGGRILSQKFTSAKG